MSRHGHPTWECIEVDGAVGFRNAGSCGRVTAPDQSCCNWCHDSRTQIFKLCRQEVCDRTHPNGSSVFIESMALRSPTLTSPRMREQSHKIQENQSMGRCHEQHVRERL